MTLHSFEGIEPTLGDRVFVAPGAQVIGDVHLGDQVSVWFNTVIRGDVFHVRIGEMTNIQDNSVIHVTTGKHPTIIENNVTVGHRALLHGCTIRHHTLVGMGAIIMDRAEVGPYSMVGAGSLVTQGTVIPTGMLAIGSPARVVRPITDAERSFLTHSAQKYAGLAARYLP